jgi:glutamate racemase
MIKPAAQITKSGVIAVCATPTTLASDRYQELKNKYAKGVKVLEPDCSEWAFLIEENKISDDKIEQNIRPALNQGADVIVLGCTHYHWIGSQVEAIARGHARVIQPEMAVMKQLNRVLEQLD